jgi:hypothetical protein
MPIRYPTLALFALASCDSLDGNQDACPAFALDETTAAARRSSPTFELVGTIYHFAEAGQLVGADTWTDVVTPPSDCRTGPYGRICHVMSEPVTHACSADAGSQ